jgi:hypothetical protein
VELKCLYWHEHCAFKVVGPFKAILDSINVIYMMQSKRACVALYLEEDYETFML